MSDVCTIDSGPHHPGVIMRSGTEFLAIIEYDEGDDLEAMPIAVYRFNGQSFDYSPVETKLFRDGFIEDDEEKQA